MMKVNMELLPMKSHYFLLFAGTAPVVPFLPVYARQLGIPIVGISLIYAILPFIGLFAKTCSGALSDCFHIHRGVFLSSIAISAVGFFSLYFCPPLPTDANAKSSNLLLDCTAPTSYLKLCTKKEKCGSNDFLGSIQDNQTVICQVELYGAQKNIEKICESWNASSLCQDDRLAFTAVTSVSHFDREGLCTFFPVNTISLNGEEIEYPTCSDIIHANSSVVCDDKGFMNYIGTPGISYEEMISHYEFWLYLICIIIAWSGFAITVVMSDTVCFQLLGAASNKYGQQRLFGSLGWGTLVIITGGLIDYASEGDAEKDYTPAFVLCVAVLFIDLFVASRLHIEGNEKQRGTAGSVVRLMCEPRIVLFVLCCVVVGISTGILWTFQLMLVEDVAFEWNCHFQALKLLQGLIMGVQCFGGELPFFFLSGWFIKKLGHVHAMSLVIGVFGIRYILYYTVTNPWVFLPIELMNGFTFGIFYATMTSYASHIAPLGTEATMQGIVGAAFEGIGIAIGGFVGGAVFATVGGSKMFLFTGIFNLIFAAIHVTLQILLDRLWIGSVSSDPTGSPIRYVPPSESMRPVAAEEDEEGAGEALQ